MMLLWFLKNIGRTIVGAAEEWHWFVPCLLSWRLFRGSYVVLWLNYFRCQNLARNIRHLSFLSILFCRVIIIIHKTVLVYRFFRRLLLEKFRDWCKYCFSRLRSVTGSYGVKTWRFQLEVWVAA